MIRLLAGALALLLFASSAAARPAAPPQVDVTVTRGADGEWIAEYRFELRSPVWFFPRSSNDNKGESWRVKSWTVETPGVRLQRLGAYDALDGGGKPLTLVRIRVRPWVATLPRDYTPAIRFSDGGLAFFSDNFVLAPSRSVASVRALPTELRNKDVQEPVLRLAFNDPGQRLVLRGKAATGSVSFLADTGNTYVYTGDTPLFESSGFGGMLDRGLPAWIRAEVTDFTPRLLQHYSRKLGPSVDPRPLAMVAWGGADHSGWTLGARVLDGMIMMQVSGETALRRSTSKIDTLRAFIGHEAAHFWLGRTISSTTWRERWITEGGADYLSVRALEALDPDFDAFGEWRRMMNECLVSLKPGDSLEVAGARLGNTAYYGCGAMLALAAEHATTGRYPRADSFEFTRGLMLANARDGQISTEDWLARFRLVTRDASLTDDVRGFLVRGSRDPQAFFRRLFLATGVPLAVEQIPIKEQLRN